MSSQLAVIDRQANQLTVADIRQNVLLIQQVMQSVMKANVHYGTIPYTAKPTLFQPGADLLCMTFRIKPTFNVEDMSTDDCYRYRVTCTGTHQTTGIEIADGVGSASSNEEKYKWRKAVCKEEFEQTPENRRRVKYAKAKGENGFYMVDQIRTEPDDGDNTVLKMAAKRAKVAMVLNATAASDMFNQDLEDLPQENIDHETGEVTPKRSVEQPKPRSATKAPPRTAAPVPDADDVTENATPASPGQIKLIRAKQETSTITDAELMGHFKLESLEGISVATGNAILAWLRDPSQ